MVDKKTTRTLLLVFLSCSLLLFILGYFFYNLQKDEIKKKIHSELHAVSKLKEIQINNWFQERMDIAASIMGDQSLIKDIKLVFENQNETKAAKRVNDWIAAFSRDDNFTQIQIYDPALKIKLSLSMKEQLDEFGKQNIENAISSRSTIIADLHTSELDTIVHLEMAIPLFDKETNGQPLIGVIFIRVDPNPFLFPLIQTWPGESKTAETLLIRREGNEVVFLNDLRFRKKTSLKLRASVSDTLLPAAKAANGFEGIFEGIDYRGVPVIADINRVEKFSWIIIAKQDIEEIYAPVRERAFIVFILVFLLVTITGIILFLVWKNHQKKYYEEKYKLEQERKLLEKHVDYLVKYANDIILLIDNDLRIVDANDKALSTYDYSKEELLRLTMADLRTRNTAPLIKEQIDKIEKLGGGIYETEHRKKDGTHFPVEVSTRAIEIENEKFYQNIIRDITERKLAEEKILRLNSMYALLSQMNQAIVRSKEKNELFDEVCKVATQFGKFDVAWIGKVDYTKQEVIPIASSGIEKEMLNKVKLPFCNHEEDNCIICSAINLKKNFVFNDVRSETNIGESMSKVVFQEYKSVAAVPIVQKGNTEVVLAIYSRIANYFDDEQIKLLEEVGIDIAFALETLETEENVHKSESQMRALFAAMTDVILVLDKNGKYLEIAPTDPSLLYKPADELIGKTLHETFPHEQADYFMAQLKQAFDKMKTVQIEYTLEIGDKTFWFEGKISPISKNTVMYIARDITERKNAEIELEISAKRWENTFNAVNDSVMTLDKNEIIVDCNEATEILLNKNRDKIIGGKCWEAVHDSNSPLINCPLIKMKTTRKRESVEYRIKDRIYEVIVDPIVNDKGELTGTVHILSDVSEKKQIIEELIKAKEDAEKANKLKSEFLAQISHEIRSPLNIVLGFLSIMKEDYREKVTEKTLNDFKAIDRAARRIIRTVDLILNMAELQVGAFSVDWMRIDLMEDIVENIILEYKLAAARKGLELKLTNNVDNPVVYGDNYSLTQVFANLIDNAIKYTDWGEINIIIDRNSSDNLRITFSDTGIGISEEYLPTLFDPFTQEQQGYTREYEGTGLGLALVKKYCDLNNAKISVESSKGVGTKFIIEFPNDIPDKLN